MLAGWKSPEFSRGYIISCIYIYLEMFDIFVHLQNYFWFQTFVYIYIFIYVYLCLFFEQYVHKMIFGHSPCSICILCFYICYILITFYKSKSETIKWCTVIVTFQCCLSTQTSAFPILHAKKDRQYHADLRHGLHGRHWDLCFHQGVVGFIYGCGGGILFTRKVV